MRIINVIIISSFLATVCLGQLNKLNITKSDMKDEMEEFVIGHTLLLLSNGTEAELMAEQLVNLMDAKYGTGWFSLIGTKTAINGLKCEKNTTLQFQYKESRVTISKQQMHRDNHSLQNLEDMLERSKSSAVIFVFPYSIPNNKTLVNEITNVARTQLSFNSTNCEVSSKIEHVQDWCLRLMSIKMFEGVAKIAGLKDNKIETTVGLVGQFFTFGKPEAFIFTIGDFYFDIRIVEM